MPQPLSFKEAAHRILEKSDRPLTAKELVEKALEMGLIATEGATPDATMGAQLYLDIKRSQNSPFKKVGRGKFTLRNQRESATSAELIIERQNDLVRQGLRQKLAEMDPAQFEFLIGDLLKELGYENVLVVGRSGDKGIDVQAELSMGGRICQRSTKHWPNQNGQREDSTYAGWRGSSAIKESRHALRYIRQEHSGH